MSQDERAQLSQRAPSLARAIVEAHDGQLGAAIVVLIDEIDGSIACSAAAYTGAAHTEDGGRCIVEMSQRMQEAFRRTVRELAAETGGDAVDRPDLGIVVPGERPKS